MESDDRTKRISQAAIGEEENLPDFYEAASLVARGVLESSQKIAGTTYCKGVQIVALAKWAKSNGAFSCLTKRAFFVSTLDETTGAHDGHRNTPKTDVPDIG